MLSIGPPKTAGSALEYFFAKYGKANGDVADVCADWYGTAAAQLGLGGKVLKTPFKHLLEGKSADGKQTLVAATNRNVSRVAGFDQVFIAPKSVGIMALFDERIAPAHEHAVQAVLDFEETTLAVGRARIANGRRIQMQTGNMLFAVFHHWTSRNNDPYLHDHAFTLNITRRPTDNEWVSLYRERPLSWGADQFYQNAHLLGLMYRSELARTTRHLGYDIRDTNALLGYWELNDVPQTVLTAFSSRRAEIERFAAELNQSGRYAQARQTEIFQIAALHTRRPKPETGRNVKPEELKEEVEQHTRDVGVDLNEVAHNAHRRQLRFARTPNDPVKDLREQRESIERAIQYLLTKQPNVGERDILQYGLLQGLSDPRTNRMRVSVATLAEVLRSILGEKQGETRTKPTTIGGNEQDASRTSQANGTGDAAHRNRDRPVHSMLEAELEP